MIFLFYINFEVYTIYFTLSYFGDNLRSVSIYLIFSSFSSPFVWLNQKDFHNFANIGKQLFFLYDKNYITVGETISRFDYQDKPKVENALLKYKNKITAVYLVDKNVILLSFGPRSQDVDGIAIRRNNVNLKNTYDNTGFDTGTLHYTELIPSVYHFTAGL